ncbi:hypothetical protein FRC15_004673 [Serendipita sp. 397]|nr:hypothetical protein FRC15_004673 [Serendipita sp. 397]
MSLIHAAQTLTRSHETAANASVSITISDDDMTEGDEEQDEYERRVSMFHPQQVNFSLMTDEKKASVTMNTETNLDIIEHNLSLNAQKHRPQSSILLQKSQQRGSGSPSRETTDRTVESIHSSSATSSFERKRKYDAGKENAVLDGNRIFSTKRLRGDLVGSNGSINTLESSAEDESAATIWEELNILAIQGVGRVSPHQGTKSLSTAEPLPVSTGPSQTRPETSAIDSLSLVSQLPKKAKQQTWSTNSKKLTKKEQERLEKEKIKRENDMNYAQFIGYLPQKITREARSRYPQIFDEIVILLARHMGEKRPHIKKLLEIMALHGARLVTRYTKEVTHIVLYQVHPEQERTPNPVIGLPVDSIPLRVKIVWGRWLSRCQTHKRLLDVCMEDHVFWDRFHAEQNEGGTMASTKPSTKRQRKEIFDSEDEEDNEKQVLKRKKSKGLITVHPQRDLNPASNSGRKDPTDEFLLAAVAMNSEDEEGIYGVGRQLGYDWSRLGLRSLDDVRRRKGGIKLTPAQELGLKYYDDLDTRMPRQEAKDIFDKIHSIALCIDAKLSLELMGSFRRGSETCGDIDILITRDPSDGHDHATLHVLPILLQRLHEENIIVADLGGEDNDELEAKYMGLCRRSPVDRVRRIDILTIPFEQWGAALVYFTGDDIFNRSMRLLANKKGMSLNQRGLYDGVVRDPKTRLKTAVGRIIASRTEQEIFRALGVPWQEPHERVRA